jgi:hypothetical protein
MRCKFQAHQTLSNAHKHPRDRRYMVDIYFYREFMGHINDGDAPPSRISNDRLVMKSANGVPSLEEHAKFAAACAARDMDPIPRPGLMENKDLVLLCQEQWDYLASIYRGGPALECLCVSARRGDGKPPTHPPTHPPTPSPVGMYFAAHYLLPIDLYIYVCMPTMVMPPPPRDMEKFPRGILPPFSTSSCHLPDVSYSPHQA